MARKKLTPAQVHTLKRCREVARYANRLREARKEGALCLDGLKSPKSGGSAGRNYTSKDDRYAIVIDRMDKIDRQLERAESELERLKMEADVVLYDVRDSMPVFTNMYYIDGCDFEYAAFIAGISEDDARRYVSKIEGERMYK